MKAIIRNTIIGLIVILSMGFSVGILLNSQAITQVLVKLNENAKEPKDALGISLIKSTKPDYQLKIRHGEKWLDCGTIVDTYVGSGLQYQITELLPKYKAKEIQLIEADNIKDDLLEQLQIANDVVRGKNYTFIIQYEFNLNAGFEWFFDKL